jgi:hypothetical protein
MMPRSGILILYGAHIEAEQEVELEDLQRRHLCRYQEIYEAQDLIRGRVSHDKERARLVVI